MVASATEFPQPGTAEKVTSSQYPGVTCQVLQAPMRDGVLLTTFVYAPQASGKYPVVMVRSPYGRLESATTCFNDPQTGSFIPLAQNGYVVTAQEVRGTYTSAGNYNPIFQEINDGYDAIEWAASQPFANGKVGMVGGSYLGIVQWQAAGTTPPHLAAIAPSIMAADYHDNVTYDNGVLDLWLGMTWPGVTIAADQIARADILAGKPAAQIAADVEAWGLLYEQKVVTTWPETLPVTGLDKVFDPYLPPFQNWLEHPYYDDYWAQIDTSLRYRDIKVPALISGDWYDPFHIGTVTNYYGMRTEGGTPEARQGTKLIMGAYGHSGDSGTPTFGDDTPDPALTTEFFDYYLKGVENGEPSKPRVNLYILVPPNSGETGTGFWVSGSDFPLPGTVPLRFYLTSQGHANTSSGDGALTSSPVRAGRDQPDHFIYNPGNPVPTTGGNMCCDTVSLAAGAQDQTAVEQRPDVLVYTGPALNQDTPVIGTVTAEFWAIADRVDTDFTVKLVDVHPDGKTHNVLDRVVRGRLRNGSRLPPSLLQPGQAYQYDLSLGGTGTIFRAGHKVRVEISSSNFPHYARNLNIAADPTSGSTFLIAHQTILHDPQHPSFIELPVHYGTKIPSTIVSTQ